MVAASLIATPLQQLQIAIKEQQAQPAGVAGMSLAQANSITSSIGIIDTKLERIEKLMQALDPSMSRAGATAAASPPPMDGINKAMLDRIERLAQLVESNAQATSAAKAAPQSPTKAPSALGSASVAALSYKDDLEPAHGELLEPLKDSEVHIQERARLDFGRRLAAITGLNDLKIVAARSLAPLLWPTATTCSRTLTFITRRIMCCIFIQASYRHRETLGSARSTHCHI